MVTRTDRAMVMASGAWKISQEDSLELLGGSVALHVVGQLPEGHLGSSGVNQEPVGGGSYSGGADIGSNDHVSEEQPGCDEGLISASGHLLHDVQVRGVEGE